MEGASHDLRSSLVRVSSLGATGASQTPTRGNVRGAGVFVDDRHVLTCAHVVCDALSLNVHETDEAPEGAVVLDLPLLADGPLRTATVVAETWKAGELDITLLRIENRVAGIKPPLYSEVSALQHAFDAYGFPSGQDSGVWVEGSIGRQNAHRVQLQADPSRGYPITPGFSGTPVWDRDAQAVVGIITDREKKTETGVAFMLPIAAIARHISELGTVRTTAEAELLATYRQRLRTEVNEVEAFGTNRTHPLRDVFFDLQIVEQEHRMFRSSYEWRTLLDPAFRRSRGRDVKPDGGGEGPDRPVRITPDELLKPRTRTVITGAPGCGKTTLLQYLTLQSLDQPDRFPVFLRLRNLTEEDVTEASDLHDLLFQKAVRKHGQSADVDALRSVFDAHRRSGAVDIYLDGLDEVCGENFFDGLLTMIRDLGTNQTGTDASLALSMRPYALNEPLPKLNMMEIQPLTDEQVETFLHTYYPASDRMDALLKEIRQGTYGDIARVPLLLNLMAEFFEIGAGEMNSPIRLYERAVEYLLTDVDDRKGAERYRTKDAWHDAKRAAFTDLATSRIFSTDDDALGRFVFDDDDLKDLARTHAPDGEAATDFFDDLCNTPLLRPVGKGKHAFPHLTMQEYLAAKHLAEQEDAVHRIAASVFDSVLADLEVLPMAIALLDEPIAAYKQLDDLPESLMYDRFLLMLRVQAYTSDPSEKSLNFLTDRFQALFDCAISTDDMLYRQIVGDAAERATGPLHERLANTLIDEFQRDKGFVINLLGKLGGENSIQFLLDTLRSNNNTRVRESATRALGYIATPAAINLLSSALYRDKSVVVREAAAHALGYIGNADALDTLFGSFYSPDDSEVRLAAAYAIGVIGDPAALARLLNTLRYKDYIMRVGSSRAIGLIGDPNAIDPLLDALRSDDNPWARSGAPHALGLIGDSDAVDPLLDALRSDDVPVVRSRAAEALGRIGNLDAIDPLLDALRCDDNPLVRTSAAKALGLIGDLDAIYPLLDALRSDDNLLARSRAAEALGRIGDPDALAPLVDALRSDDDYVRESAASALGKIGDPSVLVPLIEVLRSDDHVALRQSAAEALGHIGDPAAVSLLRDVLRSDNNSAVRKSAADALGLIGGPDTLASIVDALRSDDSSDVRESAAKALRTFADEPETLATGFHRAIDNTDISPAARTRIVEHVGFYHDDAGLLETLRDIAAGDAPDEVRTAATEAARTYQNKLDFLASLDEA